MKNTSLSILLLIISQWALGQTAPQVASFSNQQTPLVFMENKGQIKDQDQHARHDIQFQVRAANGLSIFVGNGALHYQFAKSGGNHHLAKEKFSKMHPFAKTDAATECTEMDELYRMDVTLLHADTNAQLITEQPQDYYENYYTSLHKNDCITAHAWQRVTYKNVYPHIDWVLFINGRQLEYEFHIGEGGNPADIQLQYNGATALNINADGSITAAMPLGTITEQTPVSYQTDGTPIASHYVLNGNMLSFQTADYHGALVIDPSLEWGTYFGSGETVGLGVVTDPYGYACFTGVTGATTGIVTSGAYQTYIWGAENAFLTKFDPAGHIIWSTYYGGPNLTQANSISIDQIGNLYICGEPGGDSGIATHGAYDTIGADAFLAKFNNYGFLDWGTYFKGTEGWSVATDKNYNVFLTGMVRATNALPIVDAYQPTYGGGLYDAYLAKFDSSGHILWSTYFGGPNEDNGYGLTTDSSGNAYLSGITYSISGIATEGAFDTLGDTQSKGFLAKFLSNGQLEWATYYYGIVYASTTDSSANVFITGYSPVDLNLDTPGITINHVISSNIFLAKFDSSGYLLWGKYYGYLTRDSSGGGYANSIAADRLGNIFLTGCSGGDSGIVTPDALYPTYDSLNNPVNNVIVLAQFNSSGILEYGTYYGGREPDSYDIPYGLATDGRGNVYFTGLTEDTSGIATTGSYDTHYSGFDNSFLVKFSFPPTSIPSIEKTADEVILMPNPTHHSVNLSSAGIINKVVVSDLLGQVLYTGAYNAHTASIDLSTYPNGIYLLRVNGDTVYKVVKE